MTWRADWCCSERLGLVWLDVVVVVGRCVPDVGGDVPDDLVGIVNGALTAAVEAMPRTHRAGRGGAAGLTRPTSSGATTTTRRRTLSWNSGCCRWCSRQRGLQAGGQEQEWAGRGWAGAGQGRGAGRRRGGRDDSTAGTRRSTRAEEAGATAGGG